PESSITEAKPATMPTVPNSGRNARVTAGPPAASDVRKCKDMDSSTVDLPSGAQDQRPRAPTPTTDSQTMGGRLMRSGPRPLRASPRAGRTTEARLSNPKLGTGSPAIATTEKRPQQLAIGPLPSSAAGGGAVPSSWC